MLMARLLRAESQSHFIRVLADEQAFLFQILQNFESTIESEHTLGYD